MGEAGRSGSARGGESITKVKQRSILRRACALEGLEQRVLMAVNPVAAYGFDEGAGAQLNDSSGLGNHGTISGASWNASGRFGGALSFDGVNDVVNIADSASLDLTTGMTLEAWVRPTSASGYRTVVMKEVPSELSYSLYSSGDTSAATLWGRVGSTTYEARGTATTTLNTWTHLAGTYDGTALRLYVNGVLAQTRNITGSLVTSANPLRIGGNLVWGEYFAGMIDEVRIYDRALTAGEIQADMNTPVGAPDTTAPAVWVTSPVEGASVSGVVQITANASDNVGIAGVKFQLDGVDIATEDTAAPYTINWDTNLASLGGRVLRAVARDAAGNVTISPPVNVTVLDVAGPAVSISSPADGATVAGTVNLTAAASDNRAVAGVQFYVNGAAVGDEDTSAPYSLAWDSASVPGGSYALSAVARDASGNSTMSSAVTVTVDNRVDVEPPQVAIASPVEGATLAGSVTIAANATDDIAVAGVRFLVDGVAIGAEDLATPFEVTWNALTPGTHVITAVARDNSGKTTTSAPVNVLVPDTSAPTVAITSPANGAAVVGNVVVTTSASDNVAVVGVRFYLDGQPLGDEITTAPFSLTWDSTNATFGTHALRAVARDAAGNITTSEPVSVTRVDPNASRVYYLSLVANGTVTGSVGGSVTFTDADHLRLTIDAAGNYAYRMFFDASDVGLTTTAEDIDAFTFLPDGSILVSTVGAYSVPGPSGTLSGAGEDVLRFAPASLGDATAGTWSMYFDGSDVGLSGSSATIDSLAVLADGRLLMSFAGQPYAIVGGPSADDEDLVAFTPTSLGTNTAGTWSVYFDGTDVALNTNNGEDIDALFVRPDAAGGNPTLFFSTRSAFAVPGVSGTNQDLFAFKPTTLGGTTAGTYGPGLELDGSLYGLGTFDIDGAHIGIASLDDAVAPVVSLTSPLQGVVVSGGVTLAAGASDNQTVAGVQFRINGAAAGPEDTAAPYSFAWDSTVVPNGTYEITAVARDAAGNITISSPITIGVANADATLPTISLTNPADNATVSGDVALGANASDNVGVVGVQFMVDGAPVGAEDVAAPYTFTWDSRSVLNGTHLITAVARDAAGNLATAGTRSVVVSNSTTAPVGPGQWSNVIDWPIVAINSVVLKDGRVLMWDGEPSTSCIGSRSPRVWDPVTGSMTHIPIPYVTDHEDDIFCSGMVVMADGRVLVVGGHDCDGPEYGIRMTNIFDPATMTWTRGPDMAYRRWYPTATALADGRVLITGGSQRNTIDYVDVPEIYDPVTNTITQLTSARLAVPSYAFVFQNPDGRVIVTGSDEAKMPTYALDLATQTWSVIDSRVLDGGSGVMYLPGKYMKAGSSYLSAPADNGGATPSTATTYVLESTGPGSTWQQTASMAYARTHLNLTILPDGSVLATGGSSDIGGLTPSRGVFPAEIWSPETRTWTTVASMQTPRMYHSTAILLPDGRVVVAGGGRLGPVSYPSAEVYSPGYLFKGPRPTISSAPERLTHGSSFFVGTPNASDVRSVSLIRNSSVTHSINMDQRYVPLSFTQTAGGLTVQAPPDANTAPPGYYMLFIVNSNGVPAIAPMVRLPAGYEDSTPPSAPTNLTASGAMGSASLSWSAATDDVGVIKYNVYRSNTPNFIADAQTLIGASTTTSYLDTSVTPGTRYYVVRAVDAGGNVGPASNDASAVVAGDAVPPVVSLTSPTPGASVSGVVPLGASASDDVALAGVRFLIDGVQVGAEDTSAPYAIDWDSRLVANGSYTLTAVARDAAGNLATSEPVVVNVANTTRPGLVAAYSFDESSGTTLFDASGSGFNGLISGATWNASGRFGGALSFDGVNDLVSIADVNALDLTTGMTLQAWVRPTNLSGYRTVVMKNVPGELAYGIYASGDANRPEGWARVGGTSRDASGTAALPLNTWSHLAVTYNGTTLLLFVNGTQVASRAVSGSIQTSTNPLQIGGNSVWGEYFAGLIDEVRVYNRALSAAEIQADAAIPVGAAAPPAGGVTQSLSVEDVSPPPAAPASSPALSSSDPGTTAPSPVGTFNAGSLIAADPDSAAAGITSVLDEGPTSVWA